MTPDKSDLIALPQLDEREVQFLWSVEWWDGPLNGLAEYQGKKCWFNFHHEDESGSHYHYVLYELSGLEEQQAEDWYRSRGRWDGKQWAGRDESKHDASWTGPTLSVIPVLGWFRDGANTDFYGIKVFPREHQR
jgi:hypothetical protein